MLNGLSNVNVLTLEFLDYTLFPDIPPQIFEIINAQLIVPAVEDSPVEEDMSNSSSPPPPLLEEGETPLSGAHFY